jgi:hypothetical protein
MKKLNLQWMLLITGVALLLFLIAFRRPRSFAPTSSTPASGPTSAVKPRAEIIFITLPEVIAKSQFQSGDVG